MEQHSVRFILETYNLPHKFLVRMAIIAAKRSRRKGMRKDAKLVLDKLDAFLQGGAFTENDYWLAESSLHHDLAEARILSAAYAVNNKDYAITAVVQNIDNRPPLKKLLIRAIKTEFNQIEQILMKER